jgi:release factor glutamine methyltransferase
VLLSIAQALNEATRLLTNAGVPEARKEARSLLAHVLEIDWKVLITNSEGPVAESFADRFQELVERRATGEPAQYIIGSQDFYGRTFEVNSSVLIPRPETEGLIEATLTSLPAAPASSWICDIGTGSGCIAITLLCERTDSYGIGTDISPSALEVARRNACAHDVAARLSLIESDCFSALKPDRLFDLIVSNPPYVAGKMLPTLQREVRDHEPHVALSPGDDGLKIIYRLINDAPRFLKPAGHLLIEIGFDQSEAVRNLIDPSVWGLIDILPDLQGIPRIVVLEKIS